MKIAAVLLLLCFGLCACGQKGPLYLPQPVKPAPEVVAPEASPQSQPSQDSEPAPAAADPA